MLASAQVTTQLYSENFDDGKADGWILESSQAGSWGVEGGQLVGSGHVWAEYRQAEWGIGQYSLEFDLVELDVENGLHVNVQHSDVGRYLIGLRRVDAGHLYVYLERNLWDRPSEPLASTSGQNVIYLSRVTYRVRIEFGDGQISIFLNNNPIISAQDSQPLPPGWISFENLEPMLARVDNVAVHGPQAAPEPPQDQPRDQPPPPKVPIPGFRQCDGEPLRYAEDFEDAIAQGWNLESGWSVGDGLLQGHEHYFADYPDASWEDLTLYVVFSQPDDGSTLHINIRKSEIGRYFVGVSSGGLGLQKQVGWGQGEKFYDLTNRGLEINPGEWHTLVFAMHGGSILVALDGNVQLEAGDDRPLPAGGIAFETLDNSTARIESVWVCGTPSQPPKETEPPQTPKKTEPPAPPPKPEPPSGPKLPDLRINAIHADEFDPAARTQRLLVVVQNVGEGTASSNRIRIQNLGSGEASSQLGSLSPGEATEIWVKALIPQSLVGRSTRIEVEVDPDNRIRETNEKNNKQLSPIIEFPAPPPAVDWPRLVTIAVGGTLVILAGRGIWRRLQRGRGPEPPEKEPQVLPPVLPPVRLLNVWLTEGGSGKGSRLKDDQPLAAGKEYCLHAQVVSTEAQQAGRRTQAGLTPLPLQAVVFSPGTDFAVQNRRIEMDLLPAGSSEPVFWPFRAGEPGLRRARVCVYYGNLLLQSAFVDAQVAARQASSRLPAMGALRRMLDYVSSASLTGLEGLPQPTVSIFTNRAASGSDWIGVYAAGDPLTGLADGLLYEVDPDRLMKRAGPVRQCLQEIEDNLAITSATPSGGSCAPCLSRLEQDLAKLACSGWSLYYELFLQSPRADKQKKASFDQALRPPGLVAIDRCRSEKTTLPWAAIYDLEVDTGKEKQLRLCPVFKAELESHWSQDLAQYSSHHDWLDNPQGCRLNPRCPLASGDEQVTILTICPFGFWGFRHQISQPLQLVKGTPVGQIPEEIAHAGEYGGVSSFDSTIFLRQEKDERLKLAIGVHLGLDQADRLEADITALRPDKLKITFRSTRDDVLSLLKQGGFHLYIFYCHGDRDEREQKFKLVFGTKNDELPIFCENLNPLKISWPEQPKPLVLLNGCETVAVTPEMVHGLLEILHELGAAGVVGTEIQVYPSLAYPFGLEILERLLGGASVGEAFLEERKELLRKFNPLGLAYTYYAAAALHLHVEGACGWCAAHQVRPLETSQIQPVNKRSEQQSSA